MDVVVEVAVVALASDRAAAAACVARALLAVAGVGECAAVARDAAAGAGDFAEDAAGVRFADGGGAVELAAAAVVVVVVVVDPNFELDAAVGCCCRCTSGG